MEHCNESRVKHNQSGCPIDSRTSQSFSEKKLIGDFILLFSCRTSTRKISYGFTPAHESILVGKSIGGILPNLAISPRNQRSALHPCFCLLCLLLRTSDGQVTKVIVISNSLKISLHGVYKENRWNTVSFLPSYRFFVYLPNNGIVVS